MVYNFTDWEFNLGRYKIRGVKAFNRLYIINHHVAIKVLWIWYIGFILLIVYSLNVIWSHRVGVNTVVWKFWEEEKVKPKFWRDQVVEDIVQLEGSENYNVNRNDVYLKVLSRCIT
jgi:hypothetical protein